MTERQAALGGGIEYAAKVVRRRKWLIALCLVLATAAAFVFSVIQTPKYTATAALLFTNSTTAEQASGLPVAAQTDPQGQRATDLALVQLTGIVSRQTAAALDNGISAKQVRGAISASQQGQSNIVSVSATWTRPAVAARMANTFAAQFVRRQQEENQLGIHDAIALVHRQYASLSRQEQAGVQGQTLLDHLESLKILNAMQSNSQLVQSASVPSSPSSPKLVRNTIFGAVVGLLLGLACAFLLDRFDRRMRDQDEVENAFALPLLAVIPHASKEGSADPSVAIGLEPFRMLRAHLRYYNVDRELRTLLVTSALPAEGKTTIARSLAAAAVSTGTRTLLVEADLRRPTLSETLPISRQLGLAGVLVDREPLEKAIQQIEVEPVPDELASERLLDVLPAGGIPPNPTELLESHAMQRLVSWAREHYELVVVDSAPLSIVADAVPLVRGVDGIIVVSRLGTGTRDAAHRLREMLDNLGAPVLGVVVNDVASEAGGYDGYGYGYDSPQWHTKRNGSVEDFDSASFSVPESRSA